MSFMLKRMTVRAKNNEVFYRTIMRIKVSVMDSQNFWMTIISTLFTLFNGNPSTLKCTSQSSSSLQINFKSFIEILFSTFFRTKTGLIRLAFIYNKLFSTSLAKNFLWRKIYFITCLFSTLGRTITLCLPRLTDNKFFSTNKTFFGYYKIIKRVYPRTSIRAKMSSIFSAFWDIKFFATSFTDFCYSSFFKTLTSTHDLIIMETIINVKGEMTVLNIQQ